MNKHPDTRALIETLIGYDTTSSNSNLELISFIADYLDGLGVRSELVYNGGHTKANLFATIGPDDVPGLVLSGHTDVVPVDDQDWHSDPWRAVAKDDRIYGRGASDMKSFIAVCLALAPRMVRRALKQPLHFAFSYDEEIGCVGVRDLIAELNQRELKPCGCIVGEPTGMRVIGGHKGKWSRRCRVRGLESHSGMPHLGVNAVEAAAEAVAFLKRMARRLCAEGPFTPGYEPAHSTVHTGVIRGGTALNIVPAECFFDFEFRHVPGHDPEALFTEFCGYIESELLPGMRAVDERCSVTFETLADFPGLDTPRDHRVARLALDLGGIGEGVDGRGLGHVSFGTEAGLFSESGMPSVVCGPGSITQAHKPDEFITLAEIVRCEAFIGGLVERVSA